MNSPKIDATAEIADYVVISRTALVGPRCRILPGVHIGEKVSIAADSVVGPGSTIGDSVSIHEGVMIGANVAIQSSRGSAPTVVGEGSEICDGATIAGGISIGKMAVVSPGSVVSANVPSYARVEGNPAVIVDYVQTEKIGDRPQSVRTTGEIDDAFVHLNHAKDSRGSLVSAETMKELPFKPERIFMVYDVPSNNVRGEHAHKQCHQLLIAASGSINVILDDGASRKEYVLDSPTVALHIKPGVWGIQYKQTEGATLVVLASHAYDPEDYIRDYSEFLSWKGSAVPG